MFLSSFSFLNRKIKIALINFFVLLLSCGGVWAEENRPLSPATEKWFEKFQQTESETSNFGTTASELLLNCSYLQDIWLAYLHDAESLEEYYRGMQLFQENTRNFRSICKYVTSVFNFYTAETESPWPQQKKVFFKKNEVSGFLNTFKLRQRLSAEERERFFLQEYSRFLKDGIVKPFVLDQAALKELETDTVYNFVLLPDGTIFVSLERLGDREYQVREEAIVEVFTHPNHTILAGDPQQAVVTAGALIIYQEEDKRLIFISCKSGHFQPTYSSLEYMREQLAELGVNPCTVIAVPDLDMSRCVIKTYKTAKVPVLLTQRNIEKLFSIASVRWEKYYKKIDRNLIAALAQGDISVFDDQLTVVLKKQRAEATYMRSAYHLFAADHQSPGCFGELVRRFGKLKDAVKHYGRVKFSMERVQSEASALLDLLDTYENEKQAFEFVSADDQSFYNVFSGNILEMRSLLAKESLTLEEYHQVKKLSRETGALFMYMAHHPEWRGRGRLIYYTTSDGFFQINDLMAQTNYIYAEQGEFEEETRVVLPRKIVNLLNIYIDHLGIAPPSFSIELDFKEARWVVNNAKSIYLSTYEVRELLYKIQNGLINEEDIDYEKLLELLKGVKRDAKIARNILRFLDASHTTPQHFDFFVTKNDELIAVIERQDFDWIKRELDSLVEIYYSALGGALENWLYTDQEGFQDAIQQCLQHLQPLQTGAVLTHIQAEEIFEELQAFRDLVHLIRRNGCLRGSRPCPLPIVCFDTLEQYADVLLERLETALEQETIEVTSEMHYCAAFILYKVQ